MSVSGRGDFGAVTVDCSGRRFLLGGPVWAAAVVRERWDALRVAGEGERWKGAVAAALALVAFVASDAGAWYARRRWGR